MAPGAHLVMSWLATVPGFKERRERILVALTGIVPDFDGLGIVVDKLSLHKTDLYFQYHHYLGHNLFFAIFISVLAASLAKANRVLVLLFSFFLANLHFLCDIAGSKGPDGYQWPVYYLYPLNNYLAITWTGQWELNAWQNQLILMVLLGLSMRVAATRRFSFIEVISPRLDREAFVMWDKYVKRKAQG